MSSEGWKDGHDRQMLEAKAPHFFKIILSETIRDRKLGIPRRFVRKYGEYLTEPVVYLKVPTGAIWKVELKKCDGEVWFQKGWDKFVEYYSIKHGHFLVFRYEGKSGFYVLIFDTSATEIEYPLFNTTHAYEPNIIKSDSEEEDLPMQKKRKESPLPCLEPMKMMRITGSIIKTEKASQHYESKTTGDSEGKGCSKRMYNSGRGLKSKVPPRKQPLNADAKARALERARAFKSDRPFYVVSIHPSHVNNHYQVNIPSSFISTYLTAERGNIILWVSEGRSWCVKYRSFTERSMVRRAKIYWKAFSQDNCLKVGDACVFQFIQSFEISIKVSIFRAADDANSPLSTCNRREAIPSESKRSSVIKIESGMHGTLNQFTEKELKLPKDKSRLMTLSDSKNHCALEATSGFKSDYPFFKAVMQLSYLQHGYLAVSRSFAYSYINKKTLIMMLQVEDRFWQVKLLKTEHSTILSAGWSAFVRDNALQLGDVCVFELIDRNGDILNVTIFRCPGMSSTP